MKSTCLVIVSLIQPLCLTQGALASIIDANSANSAVASPQTPDAERGKLFLVCGSKLDAADAAPLQFFYDPQGSSGEITAVLTQPGVPEPFVYSGKITSVGDIRTDYSFAPQSQEGDYLYVVRTFLAGPGGAARGYLQGSGAEAQPLQCQYK